MGGNDVFGASELLTRFAWLGAIASMILWIWTARTIWKVEGSTHHLVARLLSTLTMVGMDVVILIFLWPVVILPRPEFLHLSSEEARALVAFVVGMQVMAAIWQITAPKQGRVRRETGPRLRGRRERDPRG